VTSSNMPPPRSDIDSQFFWNGLRQHRLLVQQCTDCDKIRFPTMPYCPKCGSEKVNLLQSSGRGHLYSWVVVHYPLDPDFSSEVPYAVGVIDMDEGYRIVARLKAHESIEFNTRYELYYVDHEQWTEARFQCTDSNAVPAST
jgi:uncharacterized OB-fold protein